MASAEAIKCNGHLKSGVGYCNGELGEVGVDVPESKSLGDNHIEDLDLFVEGMTDNLDSFVEDINDRITISRMVNDSIIKGMVSAISEEAVEVVAVKEIEIAGLKEVLCGQRFENCSEDWQLQLEIRKEVEGIIFCSLIQGLHEEHERRLWDVNNVVAFIDRCKEISGLRNELQSIQKSLISPDFGHLSSQGSLDADIFHRKKVLSNHGLHCDVLGDGNGTHDESISMPENVEKSRLSHMTKQELYQFFRAEITMMKRDHESDVQKMTEEYFRLKRELLKEREFVKEKTPFASFRKDKDFEVFRKKMSEVILRLDDILNENRKLSEFCDHSRETLSSLLSENCRLRNLLENKKLETCYLSLQASDATEKLSRHSLTEQNLQNVIDSLNNSLEDARVEASISEEFYKSSLRELCAQRKSDDEDWCLRSLITQDIIGTIYEEIYNAADIAIESECGKLSLLESVTQQIYGVVVKEVLTDMSMELEHMKQTCLKVNENLFFLETKASKIENELLLEGEENKRLMHQVLQRDKVIEDKDKSLHEVNEKLKRTTDLMKKQESLIADKNEKLVALNRDLQESQKNIELNIIEVTSLNEALALSERRLRESDEEKSMFVSALEQQQNHLALVKVNDMEHMKQMESLCYLIAGLSKPFADFERRTNESIAWHSSRIENSTFQLHSLVPKANMLRRTSLLYKERLEKRCSDLQKAESEVDLLGDEVDALLRVLEKIYVALDHYSPVLQHYPGIIEILKLVRRELSAEAVKSCVKS